MNFNFKNIPKKDELIINILIPLFAGTLASLFTRPNMNIYDTIEVPPFAPPGWLFPVVWTILYILMGISAYIIGMSESSHTKRAKQLYGIQLVLNFLWPVFFFNLNAYVFSFIWLVLLWISIVFMIKKYYNIDKRAAYLQIPYLIWVTFAGILNLAIAILN